MAVVRKKQAGLIIFCNPADIKYKCERNRQEKMESSAQYAEDFWYYRTNKMDYTIIRQFAISIIKESVTYYETYKETKYIRQYLITSKCK